MWTLAVALGMAGRSPRNVLDVTQARPRAGAADRDGTPASGRHLTAAALTVPGAAVRSRFIYALPSDRERVHVARTKDPPDPAEKATVADGIPADARESDLLVVGPTLSDKDRIAFDVLAESWAAGSAPFAVTATDPAPQFRARFEPFVPAGKDVEEVYVIDCTEAGQPEAEADRGGCSVASPVDLTGVSVCLSKGYDERGSSGGRRVLVDNLSTLLIYSDIERVYRFTSTVTSNVSEVGDATVQLLDTDAIDAEDKNRLFQLFPTVVEVRPDADATLFRVRGTARTGWYEYQPREGRR
jgi:hypothetical protein